MKQKIRKEILSKRNVHLQSEKWRKDMLIMEKLFSTGDFKKAKNILFYYSVRGEVGTEKMIRESMKMGKKVLFPVTDTVNRSLSISEINEMLEDLKPGPYGIPEPSYPIIFPPKDLDMVIVPGIAFDKKGNRLGYGMGFYDRFLSDIHRKIPVIALAYEFQMVDKIPHEETDVRVQKIITEKRIIRCGK
ncbi:MAG: 5-formyltetrahydrofolate cyclo-ligase [Candidatus Aenigmarchaeota archaeon]|nr:5-formyltetrahydrofolate cyclo-ligase [Candidatus Aenigmarchaeota archaeon]